MRAEVRMIVVGLSCLAGFIVTSALVVSGVSQSADFQAALWLNHSDLGYLGTRLMVLLTDYGREVVWGILVVVMFVLGGRRTKLLAMDLAILFVLGVIVGDVAKILVGRTRPDQLSGIILRVPGESDPSYPSGHALIVSIGAGFSLARFRRKVVAGVLGLEAALVCYSRVYVGLHYPLDIAGGVLLGLSIALVGTVFVERYLGLLLSKLLEPVLKILREGPLDI